MHVCHDAPTGQGKTSQAYGEMVDLLKMGVRVILVNPHFAPVDKKGRDWRPIAKAIEAQGRLQLAPTTSCTGLLRRYEVIAKLLKWVSEVELDRRFKLQEQGNFDWPYVYLFVDEWPAIVRRHPEAAEHMIDILQRGRAVEVCVNVSAQGFLSEDVKLVGSARENFNTAYHMGGSVHSASKMLDMTVKDLNAVFREVELGQGIAMLRNNKVMPKAELVRLPYADNDYAYYMLGRADDWQLPEYRQRDSGVYAPSGTEQERYRNTEEQERYRNALRNTEERLVDYDEDSVPDGPESDVKPVYVPTEERERIIAAAHDGVKRRDMCKHLGKGKYYYETVRRVLDEEGI
jgi:hypothetical protein